jgi:hypothetical protein
VCGVARRRALQSGEIHGEGQGGGKEGEEPCGQRVGQPVEDGGQHAHNGENDTAEQAEC